jgi:type 1 glutamine amidotransferase
VLIVTGVDHPAHDWKQTAPALRTLLEDGGQCAARIVEDPEVLAADVIFDYDVLVLQFRNERPLLRETQARANLARFVRNGGGLILVHFACGAFGDWPEFGELAGRVWDRKRTHDPRGPFTVRIVNIQHPVTSGMRDFETDDELYIGLEGSWPIEVLAVARSRVTGHDHPMAFTLTYGRGRVFHTALGHDPKALQVPAVAELIRRGLLWTAFRKP